MTDGLHHGTRLVLPGTATADEVHFFVDGAGFRTGRENLTPYGGEQVWIVSEGLYFHYVFSYMTDNTYVQLTGEARAPVERFTGFARDFFSPVEVDQLVADVRSADSPYRLGFALIRLATGMPADAPPDALRLVHDGFGHAHPAVRRGALLSALYLDWPVVRAQVTDMVEHDEVDRLRHEASYFTERHERRPSPSE